MGREAALSSRAVIPRPDKRRTAAEPPQRRAAAGSPSAAEAAWRGRHARQLEPVVRRGFRMEVGASCSPRQSFSETGPGPEPRGLFMCAFGPARPRRGTPARGSAGNDQAQLGEGKEPDSPPWGCDRQSTATLGTTGAEEGLSTPPIRMVTGKASPRVRKPGTRTSMR